MPLRLKSVEELLHIAVNTNNYNEMDFLRHHPSMNVRRNLAKNRNLDGFILESLANDPVLNVSYVACNHPKSNVKRDFTTLRPCVTCDKDEVGLYCVNCHHVEEHKF